MALNGIHDILESIGVKGQYNDIEDSETVREKYPLPNISIDLTPQNEVEAREKKKAVTRAIIDLIPGLNLFFRVFFAIEDMADAYEGEEVKTFTKIATGGLLSGIGDGANWTMDNEKKRSEVNKKIGKTEKTPIDRKLENLSWIKESNTGVAFNYMTNTITWIQLLRQVMEKNYALFIGEIKLEINTGWDAYIFKADCDGDGKIIQIKNKKNYLGKDMFTNLRTAYFYESKNHYMYSIYKGET